MQFVRSVLTLSFIAIGVGLFLGARPAGAAFPGANGKIAFGSDRSGNFQIYAMNADGSGITRLTNNSSIDEEPAWSSSGTKIAFSSLRDDPNGDIYVMNADGSGTHRLTTNPAADRSPTWSPDGKKIVFDSTRDGAGEIYVMNTDGTGQTRLTFSAPNQNNLRANWSPSGTKIAFESDRSGDREIYAMNADGTSQTRITFSPGFDGLPHWSPDGTKIAFESDRTGNHEIFVMNADGTGQTNLTNNPATDATLDWQPITSVPFAAFEARVEIKLGPPRVHHDEFDLKATFTLGATSDGINPVTEKVFLQVGTFSTTIPAGSFVFHKKDHFKFEGVIDGVDLDIEIRSLGGGRFALKADGEGADLTGTVNPVKIVLVIGDDQGSLLVRADIEGDDR